MTDKQTETLKLALEALESCEMSNYGRDWVWPATAHETAMKNVKEAITAIREALSQSRSDEEQPAQQIVEEYDPDKRTISVYPSEWKAQQQEGDK